MGSELKGKILLTIGNGKIAKCITELAIAFGMTVHNANSKTTPSELNKLIKQAQYFTSNCPLNEKTHHLISHRFDLMNEVIFVNYARGGIVDEEALLLALEKKTGGVCGH